MPDALLTHCSEHVLDAMHVRTDGRTNAESSVQPRDESASVSDAGARDPLPEPDWQPVSSVWARRQALEAAAAAVTASKEARKKPKGAEE